MDTLIFWFISHIQLLAPFESLEIMNLQPPSPSIKLPAYTPHDVSLIHPPSPLSEEPESLGNTVTPPNGLKCGHEICSQ